MLVPMWKLAVMVLGHIRRPVLPTTTRYALPLLLCRKNDVMMTVLRVSHYPSVPFLHAVSASPREITAFTNPADDPVLILG